MTCERAEDKRVRNTVTRIQSSIAYLCISWRPPLENEQKENEQKENGRAHKSEWEKRGENRRQAQEKQRSKREVS